MGGNLKETVGEVEMARREKMKGEKKRKGRERSC